MQLQALAQALVLGIYAVHAAGDCLATVGTLFRCVLAGPGAWLFERFEGFYPRTFTHEHVRDDPLAARLLIYFVAAMSLVRVVAVAAPCAGTCACVGVMYTLQALAAEYEGFTSKSASPDWARVATCLCAAMALVSFLLAYTLGSPARA